MNMMTKIAAAEIDDSRTRAAVRIINDYIKAVVDESCDGEAFYSIEYAFDGVCRCNLLGMAFSTTEAAILASNAYNNLDALLNDRDFSVDEYSRQTLQNIRTALSNLWRFADKHGGAAARGFAKYVGASDGSDEVRWQQEMR